VCVDDSLCHRDSPRRESLPLAYVGRITRGCQISFTKKLHQPCYISPFGQHRWAAWPDSYTLRNCRSTSRVLRDRHPITRYDWLPYLMAIGCGERFQHGCGRFVTVKFQSTIFPPQLVWCKRVKQLMWGAVISPSRMVQLLERKFWIVACEHWAIFLPTILFRSHGVATSLAVKEALR